jgi:hypothetical protein
MNRSKIVAILTGAIAVLLSVIYLIVVQFLDFRGEMVPAPVSDGTHTVEVAQAEVVSTDLLISSPNL